MTGSRAAWQLRAQGELVRVRPLLAEDWPSLSAAASDPLIWAQHPEPTRWQPEVFRRFFDGALACGTALTVEDVKTGAVVGSSRYGYQPGARWVEIGFTFLTRACWGGPANRELKALMLRHAFSLVEDVYFVVGPANLRSLKALAKLGASVVPGASTPLGAIEDRVICQLSASAWR